MAVLALGSTLRGDDAAGLLAARRLERRLRSAPPPPTVAVFYGHTAPENLTGAIRAFRPTHVIVVDAADGGRAPGTVLVLEPEQPLANATFSTHALPIALLRHYLNLELKCAVIVVGIQPAACGFDHRPTRLARDAATQVAGMLADALVRGR